MTDSALPLPVLFVCTGNICRSPLAWAVFRQCALEQGVADRFAVDSAGLRKAHAGKGADPRAFTAACRRGYDLSEHRARALVAADFARGRLVIGMGPWHLERLRADFDASTCELRSLPEFAPECGIEEVADPYRGGPEDFERALDWIEAGCHGLLVSLLTRPAARSADAA